MSKVSVIITTYGKPVFLKNAILSVFAQSFKDIELIIVDDNNPQTDARFATESLIANFNKLGHNIVYLKHDSNKNGAVARNTALKVSKGKYISFLDNDDEYYSDRIARCFIVMEKCEDNIAGVYTGCEFRVGGSTYHIHENVQPGNFLKDTLACDFMFGSGSNIFVRKSVIDELNGFDESFLRHQDYEFLARVFKKYSLAAIPEVLLIKNNENTNLPNVEAIIDIKAKYLAKFNPIIESLNHDEKRYIYFKNYLSIAEQALKSRKFRLSKEYYERAKYYGDFSINELFRRVVLTFFYLVKW